MSGWLAAGLFLWAGAAFQQAGLIYTTAGNAGFITGLYVVLIPIFLALRGTQRPRPLIWVASLLAAAGLFLLSTGGQMRLNPGDGLELIGAVFWALHVILVGWLVQRPPVLALATGQYLVCAAFSLVAGLSCGDGYPACTGAGLVGNRLYRLALGRSGIYAASQRAAPGAASGCSHYLEQRGGFRSPVWVDFPGRETDCNAVDGLWRDVGRDVIGAIQHHFRRSKGKALMGKQNRNAWRLLAAVWIMMSLSCNLPERKNSGQDIPVEALRQTLAAKPITATAPVAPALTQGLEIQATPASGLATATSSDFQPGEPVSTPPPDPSIFYYYAQAGDTLDALALRFEVTADEITSERPIPLDGMIPTGQLLRIPKRSGVGDYPSAVLPDSEVLYSPSAVDFDIQAYVAQAGGYLSTYVETFKGEQLSGAEVDQAGGA